MSEQPRLREIGGFELISKIGQGGMGSVFKARQKSLDRIVALKVLPPSIAKDAKFIERFQREARASAKLNHPNIVQGVDVGRDEASGVWYFAMEFVDGPSAGNLLKQGALPEARALEIVRDIAQALECAASHGFVHRDIKPDNILLTMRGEAKLADLGLAKQLNDDASLTQSGQAVGTPYYMAPEQVRGQSKELDIRTDIYALGGTLFHLVTGQPPFKGETSAVIMSKHLTEPVPKAIKVNPNVSEGCSRLIEQMLQKEREKRIQSPAELLGAIERVQRGEALPRAASGSPAGPSNAAVGSRRKKEIPKPADSRLPLVLGGVGVAVVVVAGLALSGVLGGGKPAAPAAPTTVAAALKPTPKPQPQPPTEKKAEKPKNPAPVAHAKAPERTPKPETLAAKTEPVDAPKTEAAKEPLEPAVKAEPVGLKTAGEAEKPATAAALPQPVPASAVTQKEAAKPDEAKASDIQTAKVDAWPLEELLAALKENAPKKALERVQNGNFTAKDGLVAALTHLNNQREARLAAIEKLVGQPVKLDSTKGAQNGKLASFKNGVLLVEKAIFINGEARGSTNVPVPIDELTPASLAKLAPVAPPGSPAEWVGVALTAMAGGQLDAAESALGNVTDTALRDPLAAELKATRVRERESQAKAAWAKIEAGAAQAQSQTRSKQLIDELAAFSKKFADSEFATSPEIAAKSVELKEKFERLALGLDPRVLKLFKGRVLNYDARTQVITLGYDLQTREQTDDFIDSMWAPPGDKTGITWQKGQLRTFCKGTSDRVFQMPQFASGSLNIQLECKKIDTSKRNRFEVEVSFYGLESGGKTPRLSFKATEKNSLLLNNGGQVDVTDEILFRNDGLLELSCQGAQYSVKYAGKPVFEYSQPKPNDHAGFWIGGGWDSGITFTKITVSGRLDPAWLAKALEAVTPPKR